MGAFPMTLGAALAALAAGPPAIELPPWPLSPDGDEVAVVGADSLEVDGGRAEPLGGGLWRVFPQGGAREVALRAGAAAVAARVGPPLAPMHLAPSVTDPVKGKVAALDVRIEVEGEGELPPPVVAASAGRLGAVRRDGPRRFTVGYELPSTAEPEVVVFAAVVPRCPTCATPLAAGVAALPVAAAVNLPGHGEPHAKVTLTIAGRSFGPVVVDRRGDLRVPIVVPPGEREALVESEDRAGNVRHWLIDLAPPPGDGMACLVWPPALPADGRSEAGLWCAATDEDARMSVSPPLVVAARGAVLASRAVVAGLHETRYRAPRGRGTGSDTLAATTRGARAASQQKVVVELVAGPPAELGWEVAAEPVPLGAAVAARVWAADAHGDPLPVEGAGGAEGFTADGRFRARERLGDGMQRSALRVALPPSSAVATVHLRRRGAEWVAVARAIDGRPAAGVPLRFGSGAEAVTDARGEARTAGASATEWVVAPGGARAAGFDGVDAAVPPVELVREAAVALRAPSRVDVRAEAGAGEVRWRVVDAEGRPLPGREVLVRSRAVRLGDPEPRGDGGACAAAGTGLVAVIDRETGVSAVVELR